MSYIGHGLTHAIFGGFAASALLGVNLFLGAGVWGFASALMIGGVTRRRAIGSDAAIGVITTASFALGLALIKVFGSAGQERRRLPLRQRARRRHRPGVLVAAVTVAAAVTVFFAYRPLLFSTFDPEVADVSGVRTARVDAAAHAALLAATILATMNVLGVTLVAATLVIPPVVARMLTNSFARMLVLSTAIGTACGFVGMLASYHLDIAPGPTIVLTGSALFALVFLSTGITGRRRVGAVAAELA